MLALPLCLFLTQAQLPGPAEAPVAAPAHGSTILVFDLVGPEIRPELLHALSEQLAVQVRQSNPKTRVLGMTEVRAMLALVSERQKLNCQQETSCVAEIGGALGAREVVTGSLARIGRHQVLTLKRIQSRDVQVLSDATMEVPVGTEEDLLGAIQATARRLFPPLPSAERVLIADSQLAGPGRSHVAGAVFLTGAAAAAAVAVIGLVLFATANLDGLRSDSQVQSTAPAASNVIGAHNQRVLGTGLGLGGAVVAAGLGAGALIAW